MSRDFDDIRKNIDQSHKDLYKETDQDKLLKDISDLKKEVKSIGNKVDLMLEILNNFTILLEEDDEDLEDNYIQNDNESSWIHDQDEDWNSYDDEDEDD